LNVVIHRLPRMMEQDWRSQCAEVLGIEAPPSPEPRRYSLSRPRSECPHCGHAISPIENIPVVSFVWQRGRCRACDGPISWRYPIVEVLSALLVGIVAWHFGCGAQAFAAAVLTFALVCLAFIDLDTQYLPDSITLPVLWLGIAGNLYGVFTPLEASVIGAMAGYLCLWLVYHGFKLLTKKEGMGHGDFKLLALLGAWLGWQALPAIVILSSLLGSLVGIGLILARGRDRNLPMPFGPYLAGAGWITLTWGQELTEGYLHFLGSP
jgi:leader peptidase (prepilin peptidase)/N-methyltransferase